MILSYARSIHIYIYIFIDVHNKKKIQTNTHSERKMVMLSGDDIFIALELKMVMAWELAVGREAKERGPKYCPYVYVCVYLYTLTFRVDQSMRRIISP